jgi:hypothetical protein
MTGKRKIDSDSHLTRKRLKLTTASGSSRAVDVTSETNKIDTPIEVSRPGIEDKDQTDVQDRDKADLTGRLATSTTTPGMKRRRINKLVPPRPFPTVPTSVSATGPRSAHTEGKNYICLTRKTSLGAYMRRCKDVVLKDGYALAPLAHCNTQFEHRYTTLYLSAMGAAIPLLLQLSMALPPILPFPANEIRTEVTTGTVQVQDEVLPEDEDEDITYQTRGKSTLRIVIKIGEGKFDGDCGGSAKRSGRNRRDTTGLPGKAGERELKEKVTSGEIVYQEPEQESMEVL